MTTGKVTDRSWTRWLAGCAVGLLALSGAACGSSSTTTTATTASSSGSGPTTSVAVANDVAGKRYCEVLLLRLTSAGLAADVYASYPLNTCPQAEFAALDAKAIASANGAVFALLNGPRFWVMNKITKTRVGTTVTKTFGGIDMNLDGHVALGTSIAAAMAPYTVKTVKREASFTFNKGTQIYELVDASGQRWIMQSWGLIKDATLTAADLPNLASKLTLPAGWSYQVKTLKSPLVVATSTHPAQVLQDNLLNSYTLETSD
ncbi:MAG: hypothetical protein WCI26_00275 [Acidimicrobiales bacterium]